MTILSPPRYTITEDLLDRPLLVVSETVDNSTGRYVTVLTFKNVDNTSEKTLRRMAMLAVNNLHPGMQRIIDIFINKHAGSEMEGFSIVFEGFFPIFKEVSFFLLPDLAPIVKQMIQVVHFQASRMRCYRDITEKSVVLVGGNVKIIHEFLERDFLWQHDTNPASLDSVLYSIGKMTLRLFNGTREEVMDNVVAQVQRYFLSDSASGGTGLREIAENEGGSLDCFLDFVKLCFTVTRDSDAFDKLLGHGFVKDVASPHDSVHTKIMGEQLVLKVLPKSLPMSTVLEKQKALIVLFAWLKDCRNAEQMREKNVWFREGIWLSEMFDEVKGMMKRLTAPVAAVSPPSASPPHP